MVYLAVALSAALGGFVQSITGFGAAVVMMTILPYFFTMAVAPSVSTSICLGLTVTLAWKLRKSIDLKLTLPPTLLYAAASVTAIRFIGSMDLRVMTMVFGAFLMLLGAYLLPKRVPAGNPNAERLQPKPVSHRAANEPSCGDEELFVGCEQRDL